MDGILECVCAEYGVSRADITGQSREKKIAEARMVAEYLAYHSGGLSKMRIARCFGRNHSTVIYSVRQVEDWLRFDRFTRARYERIKAKLEG